MVSWRTAAVLWLGAGLSSALLVPFMTDQLLVAVFAIGAVVGIVLAAASLLGRSDGLARWGVATGALWLVVFATITLANLGDPIEYLPPVAWIAVFGAAAGWVSCRLAGKTGARRGSHAWPATPAMLVTSSGRVARPSGSGSRGPRIHTSCATVECDRPRRWAAAYAG